MRILRGKGGKHILGGELGRRSEREKREGKDLRGGECRGGGGGGER